MNTEYRPGLEGVTAGISAISEVDAERNTLTYRGYNIHDLIAHSTFDEVAYLLLYGNLPTESEFAAFVQTVRQQREVPAEIYALYRTFPKNAHPMDTLKAAVAVLGMTDPEGDDTSREANMRRAVRLYAQIPALVVNGYRIMQGQEPIPPDASLDHTGNFFQMLFGRTETGQKARAFDAIQTLYAEHGFNASTFSARVTVSTLSDMFSGVVSAIGTLKGPLHGGANEAAMAMLLEIGDADRAEAWVVDALKNKKKIMGFGHREYKKGDERAKIARTFMQQIGEEAGNTHWYETSEIVAATMLREKGLYPNLDFPVASAYYLMEIPIALYTPIFVMSRITGWCAHIMEQQANNRLIRPGSDYNGAKNLKFVPLAERGV